MYESNFFVLNSLLRGFMNVGMGFEALEVLRIMMDVGVRSGLSSLTILIIRLLLMVGDYGSVRKLLNDMIFKWVVYVALEEVAGDGGVDVFEAKGSCVEVAEPGCDAL